MPSLARSTASLVALLAAPSVARAQHGAGPQNRADYELSASVEGARTIRGRARVRWEHRSDTPATALEWHLYANAFAPGSLFLRTLSGGGHRGNAPGNSGSITVHRMQTSRGEDLLASAQMDFGDRDRTRLRTLLSQPLARDTELSIDVEFTVALPDAFSRSGCSDGFCFAGQWFPKLAVYERDGRWSTFALHAQSEFYADFGRYSLSVRAPAAATVWATGVEREPTVDERRAGVRRFELGRAHDCAFGWSARTAVERATIASAHERDGDAAPSPGAATAIDVRAVFTAPDRALALRAIAIAQRAIPALERRFGPYPYRALTLVVAPRDASGIGGMEYPSLATIDGDPRYPSIVRYLEYVTTHELAHQWFYGVLASDERREPVLDEGLCEFATGLVFDEIYGEPSLFRLGPIGISFWSMQRAFSNLERDRGPILREASAFDGFDTYANVVYRRASATFDVVHRAHPHALDRALARYAREQRFRHPTHEDLYAALRSEPTLVPVVEQRIVPAFERRSGIERDAPPIATYAATPPGQSPGGTLSLSARLSTLFAVLLRWLGP